LKKRRGTTNLKFHILAIKIISIDFSRDEGYLTLEFNRHRG